jgi:valyl-tRNA synthetase
LETALRLLHPFTPFFTEAIWQALPRRAREGDALIVAEWPEPDPSLLDDEAEADMSLLMDLIRGIRNSRAEYDVTPGKRIPALIAAGGAAPMLEAQRALLCALAKLDPAQLSIAAEMAPPDQAASVIVGEVICYLPLAAMVDLTAERERLGATLADVQRRIAHSEGLLGGQFAERAPAHVVERERNKLAELLSEATTLHERLAALE